jgi:hypothetical protein
LTIVKVPRAYRSQGDALDRARSERPSSKTCRPEAPMLSPEDREAVREAVLFASMPRELSERLIAQSIARRAAPGEILFRQDGPERPCW